MADLKIFTTQTIDYQYNTALEALTALSASPLGMDTYVIVTDENEYYGTNDPFWSSIGKNGFAFKVFSQSSKKADGQIMRVRRHRIMRRIRHA